MTMKTIKVAEAAGPALDWLVAKCVGYETAFTPARDVTIFREGVIDYFDPHRNWGWGGPIIELERIDLSAKINAGSDFDEWRASIGIGARQRHRYGDTPLIAAMRCYVASKLGETAEVPEELT